MHLSIFVLVNDVLCTVSSGLFDKVSNVYQHHQYMYIVYSSIFIYTSFIYKTMESFKRDYFNLQAPQCLQP